MRRLDSLKKGKFNQSKGIISRSWHLVISINSDVDMCYIYASVVVYNSSFNRMKKVFLNAFVLIPLALCLVIYLQGKSQKKLENKTTTETSKIAIEESSDTCRVSTDK